MGCRNSARAIVTAACNSSSIEEDPRERRVRDLEDFIKGRHEEFSAMGAALEDAQREIARLNEQVAKVRERNAKLRGRLDESGS